MPLASQYALTPCQVAWLKDSSSMVPTSVTSATFLMTPSSAGCSSVAVSSSLAGSSVLVSSVVVSAAGSVVVVSAGASVFDAQATMPRITTARSRARIFFMFVPPNMFCVCGTSASLLWHSFSVKSRQNRKKLPFHGSFPKFYGSFIYSLARKP